MDQESAQERRLRLNRERQQRWRARQSDSLTLQRRQTGAHYRRQRRADEAPEQAQARRTLSAHYQRQRRTKESLESSRCRRQSNAEANRQRRALNSPETSRAQRAVNAQAHRQAEEERSQSIRAESQFSHERHVAAHNCHKFRVYSVVVDRYLLHGAMQRRRLRGDSGGWSPSKFEVRGWRCLYPPQYYIPPIF